ncbi:MAG: hypothetical protein IKF79_02860, partial [Methanosphaera sp.]|nr:hypothetical protein [Methanosphaera sp.]
MTKNIKSIFFVLTLVTLLATVGAVCAADDTNTTAAVDSSVSDVATVSETASDTVAAEPPQTTSNDNKVDTKTIEKEDKNLKTSTKTVEVNNYNDLTSAVNSAARDTENDEYIINLNTGSYQVGGWNNVQWTTSSSIDKTITINGNNQTLKMGQGRLTINNACNMIFNNVTLDESIDNYVNLTLKNVETTKQINNYKNLSLEDSLIGYTINNNGNLSVDDNTIFGNEVTISGYGIIITNDFDKLLPIISNLNGTYTIEDKNITLWKSNSGNLTFINCLITSRYSLDNYGNITLLNCTLNRTVNNYGILIISDDTTFDDNFVLKGSGQLIINDTDRIIPYMSSYNGTYVIENMSITSTKYNYGNLTLNNCNITGSFINYGNLTINNSTIKYLTNNENANLIMNNSFITGSTENYCNMSIFNTTINASISNSKGTLIISDDSIIGSSFGLSGNGEVVINDSNRIYNYTNTFNGTHTFDNLNITKNINVYGDITIRNSIINGMIQNRANLKLINCTINRNINNYINLTLEECSVNSKISNSGNITIDDETEFNESGVINGNGNITINDLNRIVLHIQNYNGTYTLENLTTLHTQLNNYGNLTLKNCTITPFGITNYANATLTLDNCTVNRSINNYGTIIILDNCILGNEFILYNYNDGKFITNDTQKLLPHLWSFNGTYTIDNANFTSTKGNYGNLTLNDCNISTIYNNGGNITSNNCNYRSGLDNYANGMYIINNSTLNN